MILEVRNLKINVFPLEALGENLFPFFFHILDVTHIHSLVRGLFFYLQDQQCSIFVFVFPPLPLSLPFL